MQSPSKSQRRENRRGKMHTIALHSLCMMNEEITLNLLNEHEIFCLKCVGIHK